MVWRLCTQESGVECRIVQMDHESPGLEPCALVAPWSLNTDDICTTTERGIGGLSKVETEEEVSESPRLLSY